MLWYFVFYFCLELSNNIEFQDPIRDFTALRNLSIYGKVLKKQSRNIVVHKLYLRRDKRSTRRDQENRKRKRAAVLSKNRKRKKHPLSSRTLPYFETRRAAKRWEFTMVHGIGERNTIICPKKSCGTKSLYLSRHRWVAGIIVPSRNLYTRAQTISYTSPVILPSLPPSSTKHNTARQT